MVAIVVALLVLAAAVLVVASSRRRDLDAAIGVMSRETRRHDRGPLMPPRRGGGSAEAHAVEQAATLAWRSGGAGAVTEAAPTPASPPVAGYRPIPTAWTSPGATSSTARSSPCSAWSCRASQRRRWGSCGRGRRAGSGRSSRWARWLTSWPRSTKGRASPTTPRVACRSPRYPEATLSTARATYSPVELVAMEAGIAPAVAGEISRRSALGAPEPVEPEAVGDDRDAGEGHGGAGDDRIEQPDHREGMAAVL